MKDIHLIILTVLLALVVCVSIVLVFAFAEQVENFIADHLLYFYLPLLALVLSYNLWLIEYNNPGFYKRFKKMKRLIDVAKWFCLHDWELLFEPVRDRDQFLGTYYKCKKCGRFVNRKSN